MPYKATEIATLAISRSWICKLTFCFSLYY